MKILFITLLFIQISVYNGISRYLSGGFTFHVISKDSILVKLTLVRDCLGDPMKPAQINVFCEENESLITQFFVDVPAGTDVTNACPIMGGSKCSNPKSVFPFGFEQYVFEKLLILPDSVKCCVLRFTFQDCCRSLNIKTTSINQTFYTEGEINRCLGHGLSFDFNYPSAFVFITHAELSYQQGLVFYGKKFPDSIRCNLTPPLSKKNAAFLYDSPYSYIRPLYFKGFPDTSISFPCGFHVSSDAGTLEFTGDTAQTTVLSLLYRFFISGKLVAAFRREIYSAIMDYPVNHLPELFYDTDYKEVFAGDSVIFNFRTFDQDTTNTLTITYSGNLPGAVWTHNNGKVKHPEARLVWYSKNEHISAIPYSFEIIVSDNHCPSHGNTIKTFYVKVSAVNITAENFSTPEFYISENQIIIKLNSGFSGHNLLQLTDLSGKIIHAEKFEYPYLEISTRLLPPGLYILYLSGEKGYLLNKPVKFVKK